MQKPTLVEEFKQSMMMIGGLCVIVLLVCAIPWPWIAAGIGMGFLGPMIWLAACRLRSCRWSKVRETLAVVACGVGCLLAFLVWAVGFDIVARGIEGTVIESALNGLSRAWLVVAVSVFVLAVVGGSVWDWINRRWRKQAQARREMEEHNRRIRVQAAREDAQREGRGPLPWAG